MPTQIATQITTAVLGPKPERTSCSGNAVMPLLPGSTPQRQPTHSDADFDQPSHPFALEHNVPLVTMTPKDGSMEVWLGTHVFGASAQESSQHGKRASGRIKAGVPRKAGGRRQGAQPSHGE